MKQSLEHQRKELNDCRAEITALKMHIEGYRSGRNTVAADADHVQSLSLERYKEEVKSLQMELESLKSKHAKAPDFSDSTNSEKESVQMEEKAVVMDEDKSLILHPVDVVSRVVEKEDDQSLPAQTFDDNIVTPKEIPQEFSVAPLNDTSTLVNDESVSKQNNEPSSGGRLHLTSEDLSAGIVSEKRASSLYLSFRASKPLLLDWIRNVFLLPGLAGGIPSVFCFLFWMDAHLNSK